MTHLQAELSKFLHYQTFAMQFDPAGTEIGKPWTGRAFPPRNCCDLERLFLLDADWEGEGGGGCSEGSHDT
jgi:hypothetical protein